MMKHFSRAVASLVAAVCTVACSTQAPDGGRSATHSLLVAAGNGPYRERKAAALSLDGVERSQLEAALLARLHGQPNEGLLGMRDDVDLLGNIGSATAAEELVKMYPLAREDCRTDLHEAVATIRNRDGTHAFEVAEDRYVYYETRLAATKKLSRQELSSLQAAILERVVGNPYEMTTGDADVLGVIGDEEAANVLAWILVQKYIDPVTGDLRPRWALHGRLAAVMSEAVKTIRERCAARKLDPIS
jgi:hypothetical protein